MNKHNDNLPPELERYLALCKRVFERMERDGTWPWPAEPDSPKSENLVESDDSQTSV